MNLPSFKQLYYLVKLHETQHFGRAAEACFVSQSTLSAGIAALEETLGQVLIERSSKHMQFTPLGLEVVEAATGLLEQGQALLHLAKDKQAFFHGDLRLGIIPTIAPFLLPAFVSRLKRKHPQLKLWLEEYQTQVLLDKLSQGHLDLVILALPYAYAGIHTQTLFEDPFALVYHQDSQWIGHNLQDYAQLPPKSVLLMEDGHCLRDHALDACHLEATGAINTFAASSLHTLVQMVDYDLGVTFLPKMAIDAGILQGTQVMVHPQTLPKASRQIGMAWRKTSPYQQQFHQLSEYLRNL